MRPVTSVESSTGSWVKKLRGEEGKKEKEIEEMSETGKKEKKNENGMNYRAIRWWDRSRSDCPHCQGRRTLSSLERDPSKSTGFTHKHTRNTVMSQQIQDPGSSVNLKPGWIEWLQLPVRVQERERKYKKWLPDQRENNGKKRAA